MADTNLLILAREFKKLRTHVQEVLKMPVGPQGLQGEKGEQGVKGDTGAPGKDGKDGKDGVNGLNGQDGRNGADGKDGKDGLDGVGVQNAYIDFDNSLVIVLTNGQEINAGFLSQETKDAVVATFKQGAQTLNELLPIQTGNSNKYLKTDGENVSWDTLDGSDINLASPPVIGNTTPNAATFTTLTATSTATLGGDATSPALVAASNAGNTRWLNVAGSVAGGVSLNIAGAGNGDLFLTPRGTGGVSLSTAASATNLQFRAAHTASAVNYVQVTGAATGSAPVVSAQGSDANIVMRVASKGTQVIAFSTNYSGSGTGNTQFTVSHTANSANNLNITGAAAGAAPTLSTAGSDTNIGLNLTTKGTGALSLNTGGGTQFQVLDTASAVNYWQMYGNITAGAPRLLTAGTDANISYVVSTKGTGSHIFRTAGDTVDQMRIAHTASAVNYVQVTGAATGSGPIISTQGSDTNVGMAFRSKGSGFISFGQDSTTQFEISRTSSAINRLRVTGSTAGNAPIMSSEGTDTNIDLALTPKGTGNVRFGTHTTLGSEVITGYITIKDSGGTLRKLAVIS